MPNSIASKCRNYALLAVAVAGIVIIAVSLIAGIGLRPAHAKGSPTSPDFKAQTLALAKPEQRPAVSPPLAFEENQGQTDPQVNYLARGNGYTLFLTGSDAVFSIHSKTPRDRRLTGRHVRARNTMELSESHAAATAMVRMHLVDANSSARVMAQTPLSAKSNYYLGNDPRNWRTNVSNYATVSYAGVYPGIDLAYHGRQHDLEFDFMVEPEANPALIRLAFNGAAGIATDDSGNLEVGSGSEKLVFHKPFAYQQANGSRQIVDARFVIQADKVGFRLGRYDHSRELVIDPTVTFATFMGGSAEDDAYGVNFDLFGNVYITGQTASTNFPASGGLASTNQGEFDAFVTKLSADGSTVVYSTYVGGSGNDSGNAIAVDAAGDAFVAGGTSSSNFPSNGGFQAASAGGLDAFVLELAASGGSLIYSSYLGGSSDDVANGIAIDGSGNAYVAGSTQSSNFPTTSNVIQGSLNGGNNAFVAKLNSSGSALSYSTFLGGSATDLATAVAIDSAGDAYVTGETDSPDFPVSSGAFQPQCGTDGNCNGGLTDAFVAVLNPSASAFLYSTFLGGADDDQGLGIAVDSSGDAYVAGFTRSNSSFPLQSALQGVFGGGMQDGFVTELNPSGNGLVYSTFLGGNQADAVTGIALDGNSNVYVTGQTASSNFPTTGPTQSTLSGGNDAFVSEISASGSSLPFSTFLGGSQNENTGAIESPLGTIAVDRAGANIYVAGNTLSADFPVTSGAKQGVYGGAIDAFVAAYNVPTAPDFQITATTPASVSQGTAATSTVTLKSLAGYSSGVNLSCSVTGSASPLPACSASSFSPASPITPTSSGAMTTLTITTSGAGAIPVDRTRFLYSMWLPILGLAACLGLAGMGFLPAGLERKNLARPVMIGLLLASLFLMPACGGSSSGGSGGGGGGGGCSGCSPAGTYTVIITGVGADSAMATNATSVVLTIN